MGTLGCGGVLVMLRRASLPMSVGLILSVLGCGDPAGPDQEACTDQTGTVSVTVTAGLTPSFNWSPACKVAVLLIEEDASDMWGISSDEATWANPAAANVIGPPIAYGSSHSGTTASQAPLPLVSGHTYEVVLWRAVSPSSSPPCMRRFENMCLLAVHPFVR